MKSFTVILVLAAAWMAPAALSAQEAERGMILQAGAGINFVTDSAADPGAFVTFAGGYDFGMMAAALEISGAYNEGDIEGINLELTSGQIGLLVTSSPVPNLEFGAGFGVSSSDLESTNLVQDFVVDDDSYYLKAMGAYLFPMSGNLFFGPNLEVMYLDEQEEANIRGGVVIRFKSGSTPSP